MDRTLDFYDDENLEILQGSKLPDYVKEAKIRPRNAYDRFGLQLLTKEGGRNLFPISDRATTWMSARYFDETQSNFTKSAQQKIANRIQQAADRFDVDIPESAVEMADGDGEKTASAPSMSRDAALADKEESGSVKTASEYLFPERQRYPVDNEEQVKTAENYFKQHAQSMAPKRRKMYSKRLVKRAEELGVDIEDEAVLTYASGQKTANANIKLAFEARKEHINSKEAEEGLDDLYDTHQQLPADVMAEALREFDKKAGIDDLWGVRFPDPYKSVQANSSETLEKSAGESVVYQGTSMSSDDIQNISDDELTEYFSDEQISELKSNPVTVFESLPKTHKEIIVGLVS